MNKEYGFIYKVTCNPTGKSYVGQVKEFKYKNGKPYNYGVEGRWSDHVSSSKKSVSVFADAIRTYGRNSFTHTILTKSPLEELDALEAKYIEQENTITPNGYNTMRHSKVKNRPETNIETYFKPKTIKAILRPIRRSGIWKLVYVILIMENDENRRIVFGQNSNDTYSIAKEAAIKFIESLNCPFEEDNSNSEELEERYAKKLEQFKNKEITRIRITKIDKNVALYISTKETKNYKEQTRICFSSKDKSFEEVYKVALQFIEYLTKTENTIVENTLQSPQQAAAIMGATSP